MPIPPIHSSFAWVVVGVVPVTAAVLLAAALAMSLSSITVSLNALRLK